MTGGRRRTLAARAETVAVYGFLIAVALLVLLPIAWVVSTSLKPAESVVAYPPRWLPDRPTLAHYGTVWLGSNMPRYFLNSVGISLATILVTLVAGGLGGYAAARFRFPGKTALLFLLLATVMIPGIVILVPLYMVLTRVGLFNSYLGLVLVYSAWQVPTVLWLMRGFFENVPRELEEAALVDGCTRLGALVRVILPISQPGFSAAAIVVFIWVWNEFIIALTLTSADELRIVPVGLYYYISQFGIDWGPLMAGVSLALLPVLVVFALLQRRFIQGLTSGATKG